MGLKKIVVEFNDKKASIEFEGIECANDLAHGIALLILALNDKVDGTMEDTFSGIVNSVNSIKGLPVKEQSSIPKCKSK